MGITIDDVIAEYNVWKITISENVSPDCVDALDMAIDTMCKYQKIEQITKEWSESGLLQDKFYDLINEVVEDGNDRCI